MAKKSSSKSRKTPAKGSSRKRRTPPRNRKLPNVPLLAVAVVGALLAGYLTGVAWLGEKPLLCSADSGCDLVQSSRWSELFGLPIAFWGFLTFAALAGIAVGVRRAYTHFALAWIAAGVGSAISLYLTGVSIFAIEATCGWCLASLALMLGAFAIVLWQGPPEGADFGWGAWIGQTGVLAAAVVGLLHLHYQGFFDPAAGPEDPYLKALAIHLSESDAHFYGAFWCPHCREQKDLFTASADRLPYVECSPDGRRGPTARECVESGIKQYPTWIINGTRVSAVLEPKALARRSGFVWDEPPAD